MSKICSLFSGSSGNCIYLSGGGGALLIDAGVSAKRIKAALGSHGVSASELDGILITHEHGDHTGGLNVLLKQYPNLPIYATDKTLDLLIRKKKVPATALMYTVGPDTAVGRFTVNAFPTLHDDEGSCGFTVTMPSGERVAICIDLGTVTDAVRKGITGCRAVVIESNHDVTMLTNGPYSSDLKHRVLSELGHLSNTACAAELPGLVRSGTAQIILAHLSCENNTPETARAAAVASLLADGLREDEDYRLSVSLPEGNPMIVF